MNMQEKAKMTTKRRLQAGLAEGQLTLDQWDARRTEDNKVSVVDVIADVRSVTHNYAAQLYQRMLKEERVPECEMRPLHPRHVTAPRSDIQKRAGGFSHAAQPTPVATAAEMIQIVWQLPGTAEFRRNCAHTIVRYLGGDESLVDEIHRNRAAQERLAKDNPSHSARVFGEAVEAEAAHNAPNAEERAAKLRRECAEIVQLENQNVQHELQNLTACVDALKAMGQDLDDAMNWSYRDRISHLLRGGAAAEKIDTIDAGGYLTRTQGMSASLVKKLRIVFGRIAARRLRERDGLPRDAPLPKVKKQIEGTDAYVTLFRVPQDVGVLEAAYQELLGSEQYADATNDQASDQSTQSARRGMQRLFNPRA